MNINNKAIELAEAIKNSNEYISLKQAKKIIDSDLNLKRKIEEFKQKEQTVIMSGVSRKDADRQVAELNKALEELLKIPEINNYLKLEKELNMTVQRVFKLIGSSIDSGLKSR